MGKTWHRLLHITLTLRGQPRADGPGAAWALPHGWGTVNWELGLDCPTPLLP